MTDYTRPDAFRERWPSIAQIPCVGDVLDCLAAQEKEAFERITALRLALRDVINVADATEHCSVQAARIAGEALEVDGRQEYRAVAEHDKLSDAAVWRALDEAQP